jgi:heat shock protein HspQ
MHYTTTKNNVVATTQESSVMATRSPDVRILDLRKQKDAVIYLSREQTTGDDMPFYETKFKQELDAYMATQQLTTEQDKVEVRQIWLSGKFDSIAEKMKQLRTGH